MDRRKHSISRGADRESWSLPAKPRDARRVCDIEQRKFHFPTYTRKANINSLLRTSNNQSSSRQDSEAISHDSRKVNHIRHSTSNIKRSESEFRLSALLCREKNFLRQTDSPGEAEKNLIEFTRRDWIHKAMHERKKWSANKYRQLKVGNPFPFVFVWSETARQRRLGMRGGKVNETKREKGTKGPEKGFWLCTNARRGSGKICSWNPSAELTEARNLNYVINRLCAIGPDYVKAKLDDHGYLWRTNWGRCAWLFDFRFIRRKGKKRKNERKWIPLSHSVVPQSRRSLNCFYEIRKLFRLEQSSERRRAQWIQ